MSSHMERSSLGRARYDCSHSYPECFCIVMVPLLNWSSTIRTAGHPDLQSREDDERPRVIKEIVASARIIFMFWSFLVTVGFLSAFVAIQNTTPNSRWSHWSIYVASQEQSFSCVPHSGVLNDTAGQAPAFEADERLKYKFFIVTR